MGTVIGAFVMGVLRNGLNLLKVDAFVQMVIIGTIIVLGVWYDTSRRKKQAESIKPVKNCESSK